MVRPPIEILVTKRGSYRRHDRSRSKSALGDQKLLVNTFFEFLVGHGSPFGVLLTAAKASIGAALAPAGEYTRRPGRDRPLIGGHTAGFEALGP